MTEPSPSGLAGRLLVAGPALVDPNFRRTVVLVLHHDAGGSLGVVLNRPGHLALAEPLPQWVPLAADPLDVFIGGPVGSGAAICLARLAGGGPAGGGPAGGGPAG
ncbi:MAG: YqgE/AlgH family protein, partial [Acidimicrobiales bacterium]